MTTVAMPDEWRVSDGTVPLADVARTVEAQTGCTYASLNHAARQGLIDVQSKGGRDGRGNARRITVEDALLVLAVAALAVAAGMAFGHMLKAMKSSGAQVTPAGLTIPLKVAA